MSPGAWLRGVFWERSLLWRRPARRLRRLVARWRGRGPRIEVADQSPGPSAPIAHPAIAVYPGPRTGGAVVERFLADQTETSVSLGGDGAAFCFVAEEPLRKLPPTHLEALLLAALALDLEWTVAAWPAELPRAALTLLRTPDAQRGGERPLLGKEVPHVTDEEPGGAGEAGPGVSPTGDVRRSAAPVRLRASSVFQALAGLPTVPGPRTALFLVPYMAVGGAERQLLDLLAGLRERYRLLVVTLSAHRAALGRTLDDARRLTPHVYTLGDWLPRPARFDVLLHLIRRYSVESLVSWNGTVEFYDHAGDLRRAFPGLRILSQVYNHAGGWIDHLGPRLLRTIDVHLAVNHRISAVLEKRFGVPGDRIAVLHTAVELPELPPPDVRLENRRRSRRELGLPDDAVVVGTFVRMHPQKRPLDVVELARRMEGRGIRFLLVGGGPLDEAVERDLAERPAPHLLRLPMTRDVERLYDALDLCLLVSSYEGLPVFLLDGLARAIPCVATGVGDVPLMLAEGGGILVERPGDLDALEAAVAALCDDDRRAAEGALGRAAVARRFRLEPARRRYESLIFPPLPESPGEPIR